MCSSDLSRTLAFVRERLSFVGQLLATIRETLPLIGDAISSGSKPFATSDLSLTAHYRLLALVERGSSVFQRTVALRPQLTLTLRGLAARKCDLGQIGVHIRLFQNPHPFAVWFHIT